MTTLRGATIQDFIDTVEDMRQIYPFKNDTAKIVDTYDPPTQSHNKLELYIYDEPTGIHITLQKDIITKENGSW